MRGRGALELSVHGLRYPFFARHESPETVAQVGAHVGLGRDHMEDAWAVALDVPHRGRRVDVFAVFDGLGGLPHGQEAAWAAARGLRAGVERAQELDRLLVELNGEARAAGGNTTAVVAVAPRGEPRNLVRVLSIGDSSAFALDAAGGLVRLLPPDKDEDGLTDALGQEAIGGHSHEVPLPPGASLLLCTDGVDGVVEEKQLASVLAASAKALPRAMEDLLQAVLVGGAPDNAAALVLHRKPA